MCNTPATSSDPARAVIFVALPQFLRLQRRWDALPTHLRQHRTNRPYRRASSVYPVPIALSNSPPYPIRAGIVMGKNPLARRTRLAL